jgi:hypothetical protein
MYRVEFSKDRAIRQANCLKENKPFEPEDREKGWTYPELLGLAGLIHFKLRRRYLAGQKKALIETDGKIATETVLGAIDLVGFLNDEIDCGKYEGKYRDLEDFVAKTILPDGKCPIRQGGRINKNNKTDNSGDIENNYENN